MTETSLFGEELRAEFEHVELELNRIEDLAESVGTGVTRALRRAIVDGRSLSSLLGDITRRFADLALAAALKPLGLAISGAVDGLFRNFNPALSGVVPFAKGGVIARPSFLPLGNGGLGLAGEAGPEAILPLSRGADGRLGVASSGAPAVTINMNITTPDAPGFLRAEAEVSAMLLRAVRRGTRAS